MSVDDPIKAELLEPLKGAGTDLLLDMPLKKAKFDDYAAYLYAASMEPLYLHFYEQWSSRQLSPFRALPPQIGVKEGYQHSLPPHLPLHVKQEPGLPLHVKQEPTSLTLSKERPRAAPPEPPRLQHPEKVVPHSECDKFERSFQPNVALAPQHKKYRHTVVSEASATPLEASAPRVPAPKTVVVERDAEPETTTRTNAEVSVIARDQQHPPAIIAVREKTPPPPDPPTTTKSQHSVIMEATNYKKPMQYNSEIELSTDTDDSFSDVSANDHHHHAKRNVVERSITPPAKTTITKVIVDPVNGHSHTPPNSTTPAGEEEDEETYVSRIENLIQAVGVDSRKEILEIVKILANDNRTLELLCRQKDEIINAQQRKIFELEQQTTNKVIVKTEDKVEAIVDGATATSTWSRESSEERVVTSSNTPETPPNSNNNNNNSDNNANNTSNNDSSTTSSTTEAATTSLELIVNSSDTKMASLACATSSTAIEHSTTTSSSPSAIIIKTEPE